MRYTQLETRFVFFVYIIELARSSTCMEKRKVDVAALAINTLVHSNIRSAAYSPYCSLRAGFFGKTYLFHEIPDFVGETSTLLLIPPRSCLNKNDFQLHHSIRGSTTW